MICLWRCAEDHNQKNEGKGLPLKFSGTETELQRFARLFIYMSRRGTVATILVCFLERDATAGKPVKGEEKEI